MKFAILLRGFHFMKRDRHGFYQHYGQSIDSFKRSIMMPLMEKGDVDLYIATYPSDCLEELVKDLSPCKIWVGEPGRNTQVETFFNGIDLIAKQNTSYDKIICTRFDLSYIKTIDQWPIWENGSSVYLPWREHYVWWNKFRNTGDFIHVVDGAHLNGFMNALKYYGFSRTDMHTLYHSLVKFCCEPLFLSDGYFTSDPMYFGKSNKNPIYRITHRPDLISPNFDNTSTFLGFLGSIIDKVVARITGKRIASWEIRWRTRNSK